PVIQILHRYHIPFIPRAAATNHAGSCSTPKGGAVLNLAALTKILQINTQEEYALVEPGVVTGQLQQALSPLGFFYAPDPASERICTLGGNVAQNASGARCLKYGGTLDALLEAQVVLPTGETVSLSRRETGPDWLGLLAGSEGTLGIITLLKVKILPKVPHIKTLLAAFPTLENSIQAVTELIKSGITPRCIEAMDRRTLGAIEDFTHAGYPAQAEALLILEIDGKPNRIAKEVQTVEKICRHNRAQEIISAPDEQTRLRLWKGRQAAYAVMARLAPNVLVCDGTVPHSQLPQTLKQIRQILTENQIQASLLFHAGDGNFHPQLIFDERNKPEVQHINRVVRLILKACIEAGGTISGEHGIGIEKRSLMAYQYDTATLDLFVKIKHAFDPEQLANPLKIIPLDYAQKAIPSTTPEPHVEKIAAQMQDYTARQIPFRITGGSLSGEGISTKDLNQIKEIDLNNYTVTVQSGVTLRQLAHELKKKGVYSLLPETADSLGGAFSSGRYPGFYAQVTGLQALLPNGSLVRYGGKFTKNAAGYNLIRLFAGAQGTFGCVTELTFRIYAVAQPVLAPLSDAALEQNILWKKLKQQLDPAGLLPAAKEQVHG
ncbi:MAG: FAD-binding protein, partial [Elusimicrobiaceae bacterium]|nr:FAD-binding protein [Elusimicrobiaceae bacterium]